jgi:general secretion pathway protein A
MYLDFYGFKEAPFSLSPNPRFIFFSKTHKEAFALLLYGINKRFGFIELIGEVGTGKTTVLRTFLSQLDEEKHRTALIFNPSLSATDLMRAINREFGISHESTNVAVLLGALNDFLLAENAAGRTVVLVIDEAQNLAPDVLEQIRLVSNLETDTAKLIQIVLAGQPELARLLEKPELRQINQRIALRYNIHSLDRDDFAAYVEHRLSKAGGRDKVSFTPSALGWLYRYSRGTPRLINILCDRALLIGYTEGQRKITARTMALAFRDVMLKPAERVSPFIRRVGATLILIALLATGGYAYFSFPKITTKNVSAGPATASPNAGKKSAADITTLPDGQPLAPDFRQTLRSELAVRSEVKTALQAYNALTSVLRAPPLRQLKDEAPLLQQLKRQAKSRLLEMTGFTGNMDDLLRLDSPALLLLSPKESKGNFLVALTGERDGKLLVHPPLLGRNTFSKAELASVWSGRAYLLWRNAEHIPLPMTEGASGNDVIRLQILLQVAGLRTIKANGRYDETTMKAVKDFQTSRRISATGEVGPITLIQLYKAVNAGSLPSLASTAKGDGL